MVTISNMHAEVRDLTALCLVNAFAYIVWLKLRPDPSRSNPLPTAYDHVWMRVKKLEILLSIAVVYVARGWLMQMDCGQLMICFCRNAIYSYDLLVVYAYLSIVVQFLRPVFFAAWYGEVQDDIRDKQQEIIDQSEPQEQAEIHEQSEIYEYSEMEERPAQESQPIITIVSNKVKAPRSKTILEMNLDRELEMWTPKAYREKMAYLMVTNAQWGDYEPFLWNVDVEVPKVLDKEATASTASSMTEIGSQYDPSGQWTESAASSMTTRGTADDGA